MSALPPPAFPDPHGLEEARRAEIVRDLALRAVGLSAILGPVAGLALWCSVASRLLAALKGSSPGIALVAVFGPPIVVVATSLVLFPAVVSARGRPARRAQVEACELMDSPVGSWWVAEVRDIVWVALLIGVAWSLQGPLFFLLPLLMGAAANLARLRSDPAGLRWPRGVIVVGYVGTILGYLLWVHQLSPNWRVIVGCGPFLLNLHGVLALRVHVPRLLQRGRRVWPPLLVLGLPLLERIELQLDAGEIETATRRLRALLPSGTGPMLLALLARALELEGDPRAVHLLCISARHFPDEPDTFKELALHAPDHDTALAYAKYAEACALRSRMDPAPFIAAREALERAPTAVQ